MNKSHTPVWIHKIDFDNSTIVKQDYFAGISQDHLFESMAHTYTNNIVEMRNIVSEYMGFRVHSNTHDSKVREAYTKIRQPKFVTIKEILKIIR